MENKEMYTKQEVVEMLKDMQRETGECVGFFVGQVSQLWVIKDLIEKRLNDMGETVLKYELVNNYKGEKHGQNKSCCYSK